MTTRNPISLSADQNPEGLDVLPAPHPSTLAELFDQCDHSLQALSGISQLPDEQQAHDVVRAVADSATEEFREVYERMGDLSGDPLVDELLDALALTANRVQSELDGTSTEPCFAERIAIGLLQDNGIPESDRAVGGRLLALEWEIDADGANALLESFGSDS